MINMGNNAEIPYVVHKAFNNQNLPETDLPSYTNIPGNSKKKPMADWSQNI
jgi:hypothetical protein